VSDTKAVLHDVGEGEKLFHLFHQSAKLALHMVSSTPLPYNDLYLQESVNMWQLLHYRKDSHIRHHSQRHQVLPLL
jgi:hypothetical protein